VRYWLLTIAGLAIAGASLVLVDQGLYHLVRTGTCASGGPYVSARPCPPGTGGHILALVGGGFGIFLGVAAYSMRGGRGRPSPIGLGTLVWALGFLTMAASAVLAAWGPGNTGDSSARLGAGIVAGIFVPLGLAPLLAGGWGSRRGERARLLVESGSRCPGEVVSVDDTGITINNNPRVRMTVRAEPPGEPPFTIEKTVTVSRVRIPHVGERCTVFYDPADREHKNGITFDHVPGTPAAPVPQPAVAVEDDDDPLERIERLGELRDKGLVTEAEFQEQKRRLLGEV
jgi:hypothetical protein